MSPDELIVIDSETSRLRALLLNSKLVAGVPEADSRLLRTSLAVSADRDALSAPAAQAALLTAVAIGVRTFGEIAVPTGLDLPAATALPIPGRSLREQALALGARERLTHPDEPLLLIGPSERASTRRALRAVWFNWTAGVQPAAAALPSGSSNCALAAACAGALGVAEAFFVEYGNLSAGRRVRRLCLWSPGAPEGQHINTPEDFALALAEWVIGLGNLGQAHLWCLSLLPYPKPNDVQLTLQDFDRVRAENWGTSLLVERGRYGELKSKCAEDWCRARGFTVRSIDRRLDKHLRLQDDEPVLAIAGLDRIGPRRQLSEVGFDHILDVGLGADADTYHQFRVTHFDRSYSPRTHFKGVSEVTRDRHLEQLAAYQTLLASGRIDACGVASLAGIPVAVPFVSLIASAVALTQAIRLASGLQPASALAGSMSANDSLRQMMRTPHPGRITFPIVRGVSWPK